MTRSFSALVSLVCLLLGSCGLLVTATNCAGMIRASIASIIMASMASMYLKQANEKPVGFWVNLYRSGMVIVVSILFIAIGRIVTSAQGLGCQL